MSKVYTHKYLNTSYVIKKSKYFNVQFINKSSKQFYLGLNVFCGSKDNTFIEKNKRIEFPQGIAHVVEHLAFCLKQENIVNDLINQGIEINAATSNTGTCYYMNGPKQQIIEQNLYKVLFEIVNVFKVGTKEFNAELKIVLEEASLEFNDKEYLIEQIIGPAFFNYGLSAPLIGSQTSLKQITLANCCDFYTKFYHFDNMVLTIVGELSSSQIDDFLQQIDSHVDKLLATHVINSNHTKNNVCKDNETIKKINPLKQEFTIKTNSISSSHCQYYVPIKTCDKISIKEKKYIMDILLNLVNEEFSNDYKLFLNKYNLWNVEIEFWYKNVNDNEMFLIIEISNTDKVTFDMVDEMLKIIKTKLTIQQFQILNYSNKLDVISRNDWDVETIGNELTSQILFYNSNYNDQIKMLNDEVNVMKISYEATKKLQETIYFEEIIKINVLKKE